MTPYYSLSFYRTYIHNSIVAQCLYLLYYYSVVKQQCTDSVCTNTWQIKADPGLNKCSTMMYGGLL